MKRKLLSTLLITMTAASLVACTLPGQDSGSTNNTPTEEEPPVATTDVQNTETDDTTEADDDTSSEKAEDFKTFVFNPDTPEEIDLGSDGKQDEVTMALNEELTKSNGLNTYDLKVNDKTIPVMEDDEAPLYNTFDFHYLHQNGQDYVLVSLEGNHGLRCVKGFQWDGSTFQQKDDVQGSRIYEIHEDFVLLAERIDVFGTWEVTTNYTIDKDKMAFATEDKYPKIVNPEGLKLKKDYTFDDDSGEAPKTAKAGDVIYPSCLAHNNGYMGFEDKDGNELGYMPFDVKDDGSGVYVDGVKETDLFENDFYAN
ncbi:MAG: hypothetical protein K5769_04835 [Pseudobutyrivibrio sp.]|nr:hypothetical protein [Pseudobutyrivibrio sp.]